MIPVWAFILLLAVIGYLLYLTRTTEEDIVAISKAQLAKLKEWMKESGPEKPQSI